MASLTLGLATFVTPACLWGQSDVWHNVAYLAGVIALFLVPYLVSRPLARRLRVPEYRTRLGIVLFSLLAGVAVVAVARYPRFGVDLRGGVILVYKVDVESTAAGQTGGSTEDQSAEDGQTGDSEPQRAAVVDFQMGDLVEALKRRLNPDGLKEIVIRPYGVQQVEIIVPQAEGAEIEAVKRSIATAGVLLFRIVANTKDHMEIIREAERQLDDPVLKMLREVRDPDGRIVARWVPVARAQEVIEGIHPLKENVAGDIIRDGRTGQRIVNIPREAFNSETRPVAFEKWLASQGIETVEVLMVEPEHEMYDVRGDFLGMVRADFDENLRPCVRFSMKGIGAARMAALTSRYRPDKDPEFYRRLGIILDNQLLSAPRIMSTIAESGQITGRFTQQEVDELVRILRAGKLPAVLHKEPISENQIGPMLGLQTIRQGSIAIAISLLAVLFFMLVYYRWAGGVACLALLLNLLLTYSLLIVLSASLTLPGLAGLVLTVGMSVDANVLIFERIREELKKGAALRMAIRNGFDRALNTIVDANVTTLITGIVLYVIGTDQVRGFAVTLNLGILMCLYTGVYCSRLAFEIGERNRWITKLRMLDWVGTPSFDFMGKARPAIIGSLVLIVAGIAAVVERNQRLLDKDIAGGVSVVMALREPMSDADVRRRLDEAVREARSQGLRLEYTLNHMTVEGRDPGTIWKVDSSFSDVDQLKDLLARKFDLVKYSMTFDPVALVSTGGEESSTSGRNDASPAARPPAEEPKTQESPTTTPPGSASGDQGASWHAQPDPYFVALVGTSQVDDPAGQEPPGDATQQTPSGQGQETPESGREPPANRDVKASERESATGAGSPAVTGQNQEPQPEQGADARTTEQSPAESAPGGAGKARSGSADQTPEVAPQRGGTVMSKSVVRFINQVEKTTLQSLLEETANELHEGPVVIQLVPEQIDPTGRQASTVWHVQMTLPPQEMQKVLEKVQAKINDMPVWIQASSIGSQVARGTRNQAIAAAIASLIGIVLYIWIRFQRVAFGLAAVVALVHDVLVALGMIALSHYIAPVGSFLLIEEFKISLPVVAALMTLIGYSLNDTIVVFDRIREVRGRSPQLTAEMINTSVNQTLSRTLLTAGTTLLVVAILYAIGGEGIHGFAFTLLVGLIVGTYSSIFIASAVLLWMVERQGTKGATAR
ncbi:MAG: protein-export membrane protein SecD [Pirellulaceae bacterium]|nr:MAG: protein-export membrane protein SecD [Pirellulaceae bacterium]